MDPKKLQDALLDERYGEGADQDSQGPGYEAAREAFDELNELLALSEAEPPRPGFDTRFYARLNELKGEGKKTQGFVQKYLSRTFWWLAPAGALAAALLVIQTSDPTPELEGEQLAIAMELELLEDFETIRELEALENFELIAQLSLDQNEQDVLLPDSSGKGIVR